MKKYLIYSIILLTCLNCTFAQTINIKSKAAIIINAETGQVLYAFEADTPMPPASTTKILTALLILNKMELDETVNSGETFVNPGGSHIAIDHNESFKVIDLLYALLVESANDAAAVLAIAHSGSIENFTKEMNAYAKSIGATHSHFANPHGLDDKTHLVTAKDMAIIASKAMENATFRKIVNTKKYTIPPTNKKNAPRDYIKSHNFFIVNDGKKMRYNGKSIPIYDERIEGIKTGYTGDAGNCLVSSISTEGTRYIAVVFGASNKDELYGDSKSLLEHAINNFKHIRIVTEGEVVTNIKVPNAESTGINLISDKTITRSIPKTDNKEVDIKHTVELYDLKDKVIKMGLPMGKATYSIQGKPIATVELLAQRDIATRDLVGEITNVLATKSTFDSPIDIAVLVLKLILAIVIWRWIIVGRRKRIARKRRNKNLKRIRSEIKYTDKKEKSNVLKFNPNRTKK